MKKNFVKVLALMVMVLMALSQSVGAMAAGFVDVAETGLVQVVSEGTMIVSGDASICRVTFCDLQGEEICYFELHAGDYVEMLEYPLQQEGYEFNYWYDGMDIEANPFDFTLPVYGDVYLYPYYQLSGTPDESVQTASYQTMPEDDIVPEAILDVSDSGSDIIADSSADQILNTIGSDAASDIISPVALTPGEQELKTVTGSAQEITLFDAVNTSADVLNAAEILNVDDLAETDEDTTLYAAKQMGMVIDFSDIGDIATEEETMLMAMNLGEAVVEEENTVEGMIIEDIEDEAVPLAGPANAPYVQIDYDFSDGENGETLVTMTASLCNVPDGLNISYHWQNDMSGDYADVDGAVGRIYTFSASEYTEGISWRCAVDIIG